jgi:Ca2+-binding RTX toxin-like protein
MVLGGIGNDRIVMDVAAGNVDTADGGIGLDTLALVGTVDGDGIAVVNLSSLTDQVTRIGSANPEGLLQSNFENLDASGLTGTVTATGSAGANVMIGSDGADTLTGLAGNDILTGGAGDDTLSGGLGNDTFLFDAGDGQDFVEDNSGIADVIRFGATIDSQDLVISRQADDLRFAVAGSTDSVTIHNWYADPVNRTETIQAGDGQTLLSAQVDVLIQAMATFTTQTGLAWETASTGGGTAEQQATFQNIIAANWQS